MYMYMDEYKKIAIDFYRYYILSKNIAYLKTAKAALKEYKYACKYLH